jgi:hypothetical protein
VQTWNRIAGAAAAEDITTAVYARTTLSPSDRLNLAGSLIEVGLNSLALRLVKEAAQDPTIEHWRLADVASKWVMTAGAAAADELAEFIEHQSFRSGLPMASAADGLADAGCAEPARRLARRVLVTDTSSGNALGAAARAWMTANDGAAADEILSLVADRWSALPTFDRASLAQDLAELGFPVSVEMARSVLADRKLAPYDAERACEALLQVAGDTAIPEILDSPAVLTESPEILAAIAKSLAEFGAVQEAYIILVKLLHTPTATLAQAAEATAQLITLGRRSSAITALRAALSEQTLKPQQRSRLKAALAWVSLIHPNAKSCGLEACEDPHASATDQPNDSMARTR